MTLARIKKGKLIGILRSERPQIQLVFQMVMIK